MKLSLRHFFYPKVGGLLLVALLGLQRAAWSITPGSKPPAKTAKLSSKKSANKAAKSKQIPEKEAAAIADSKPPQASPIKKPKPLKPAQITQDDPLIPLDQVVVQQHIARAPYVPFVQTIGVSIDYGKLAMNLWTPKERRHAVSLITLFRSNIQLSATFGYNQLTPQPTAGNRSKYTVKGKYGCLGLDHFAKYDPHNNLYTGLRYGKSWFTCHIQSDSSAEKVVSQDLTAFWWELVVGSEHQLFKNFGLYAGLTLRLKSLGNFGSFEPATNYVVPGYGRSVTTLVPSATLYVKYEISFLKKQISFK